ncbi:MAG TPA: tetratricopeptide repeat protein, partial [Phenylobacterium sp.]|nr:tetratricopeptide repeat protein [Phenylobacterium sp.]
MSRNTWRFALGLALAVQCASSATAQEGERPVISADAAACGSGKPEKVIPGCSRIIQDKGRTPVEHAIALRNRGYVYQLRGEWDRAIADYDGALKLGLPAAQSVGVVARTYVNRGIAYAAKGDDSHAIADYGAAIAADPTVASAYLNRAAVALRRGDDANAQ